MTTLSLHKKVLSHEANFCDYILKLVRLNFGDSDEAVRFRERASVCVYACECICTCVRAKYCDGGNCEEKEPHGLSHAYYTRCPFIFIHSLLFLNCWDRVKGVFDVLCLIFTTAKSLLTRLFTRLSTDSRCHSRVHSYIIWRALMYFIRIRVFATNPEMSFGTRLISFFYPVLSSYPPLSLFSPYIWFTISLT